MSKNYRKKHIVTKNVSDSDIMNPSTVKISIGEILERYGVDPNDKPELVYELTCYMCFIADNYVAENKWDSL